MSDPVAARQSRGNSHAVNNAAADEPPAWKLLHGLRSLSRRTSYPYATITKRPSLITVAKGAGWSRRNH
jgi:hypothetical protein